jgi:hypothetical protein
MSEGSTTSAAKAAGLVIAELAASEAALIAAKRELAAGVNATTDTPARHESRPVMRGSR